MLLFVLYHRQDADHRGCRLVLKAGRTQERDVFQHISIQPRLNIFYPYRKVARELNGPFSHIIHMILDVFRHM